MNRTHVLYKRTLLAIALGGMALPQWAGAAPDAGQLLEQTQRGPALPPPEKADLLPVVPQAKTEAPVASGGAKFTVKGFRFTGVTIFDQSDLQNIVAPFDNTQVDFQKLQEIAEKVTAYYVSHGYLLARARFPTQGIDDGIVEINVLEGNVEAVSFTNASFVTDNFVRKRLDAIPAGQPLNIAQVERALLLLKDTPGVEVQSVLKAGKTPGTSDLDVNVGPGKRIEFAIGADNEGNSYTGEYRANAGLTLNSPLAIGDQLQANFLTAGDGFSYGHVAWQVPINSYGTKIGIGETALVYKLGRQFESLDAKGRAHIDSLFATHPVIRSIDLNLEARLGLDHKTFDDSIQAVQLATHKQVNEATFGLALDSVNPARRSVSQLVVSAVTGTVTGDASIISDTGPQTSSGAQAGFVKLNLQAERLQGFGPKFSLSTKLALQYSNDNLDSSEKNTLGGSSGVRAYPQGEAPSDKSWLANLELRYQFNEPWQLYGFYDVAQGFLNAATAGVPSRRNLSGVGFGTRWNIDQKFNLVSYLAWRTSGAATSDQTSRVPRLVVQVGRTF